MSSYDVFFFNPICSMCYKDLVQYVFLAGKSVSFLLCLNHEPELDLYLVSAPQSSHLYSPGESNLVC